MGTKCKASVSNNSGSIKHRAMKFVCSMGFQGFWPWQIELCDLCHLTASNHA